MIRHLLTPILLGAAAAGFAAGAAGAQTVATAQNRSGEPTTAQQIDAWVKEGPPPTTAAAPPPQVASRGGAGPDSPWADGLDSPLPLPVIPWDAPPIVRTLADGRVHGEVGAEIGTGGYGGYAVASGPLGRNGALQIGVSDFQPTGRARRYYGGGDRKSLSVSLAFSPNRDKEFEGWRRPEEPAPSN